MILLQKISKTYQVRRLCDKDLDSMLILCQSNPLYYQFCKTQVTKTSLLRAMKNLPKGKNIQDKYYLGYFEKDHLIAILDLVDKYPNEYTMFIGFLMVDKKFQHIGVASKIIEELKTYLTMNNYKYIRLGYVMDNYQSKNFWSKNKFKETGIKYNTDGYTVVVLEYKLNN